MPLDGGPLDHPLLVHMHMHMHMFNINHPQVLPIVINRPALVVCHCVCEVSSCLEPGGSGYKCTLDQGSSVPNQL